MKRFALMMAALLLAGCPEAWAQLAIKGDLKVQPYKLVRLEASGQNATAALIWDIDREEVADMEEVGAGLRFTGPPGSYRVKLRAIRLEGGKTFIETARAVVVIGEPTPPVPPLPPVPPGPGPGPNPPGPVPIPVGGLKVLIVFETGDKLTPGQHSAIYGAAVRKYLEEKCAKESDSGWKAYRIFDKDQPLAGESQGWKDLMARPRTAVPWLVVQAGNQLHEAPLPATLEETLTVLKKFGG